MSQQYIQYPTSGTGGVPTVPTFASLPVAGAFDGQLYVTLDTDYLYVWNLATTSWIVIGAPGAIFSIGTIDSGTPSANGGSVTGGALLFQSASGTVPGLVNTTTQTFLGKKTFTTGIILSNLTASTALASDASKNVISSSTTATELGYVHGVTSAIQTQLNAITGAAVTSLTGDITGTGPGATATTLATVNSNVGSFTNASLTVNAKGLVTAASSGTAPVIGPGTTVAGDLVTWNNTTGTLTADPSVALFNAGTTYNNLSIGANNTLSGLSTSFTGYGNSGSTIFGSLIKYTGSGSANPVTAIGSSIFLTPDTAGWGIVAIGNNIGVSGHPFGQGSVVIGSVIGFGFTSNPGIANTIIGSGSVDNATGIGTLNTLVGAQQLQGSGTFGSSNTVLGANAGHALTSSGNVFLGVYSGYNADNGNEFYLNNVHQNSYANDKAFSLLYGTFSGTAGSLTGQTLTVNAATFTTPVPTLPAQTANTVFAGPTTGAAAAPTFRTQVYADISPALKAPTVSVATLHSSTLNTGGFAGSTTTYTTPAGVLYIKVTMVGGGGGGSTNSGGNDGGTGTASTFGTALLSAGGGVGGSQTGANGAGGTSSLGSGPVGAALGGSDGGAGASGSSSNDIAGGNGGSSALGGAGGGGAGHATNGNGGKTNTGAGGGGGGGSGGNYASGAGGGSGGYVCATIFSPAGTYAYVLGPGGNGGSGGTSNGGAGGSGIIIVEEYYQ